MNDPNLTDRLYECGAVFAKDIDKQMSPIISFLLTKQDTVTGHFLVEDSDGSNEIWYVDKDGFSFPDFNYSTFPFYRFLSAPAFHFYPFPQTDVIQT